MTLATVQVGEAEDAELYAKAIGRLTGKLGVSHLMKRFAGAISPAEFRREMGVLNADSRLTGIMLLEPLPAHLNSGEISCAVDFFKDVEGRRAFLNFGSGVMPPTACAAMALIEETGCRIEGREAVVIGRSAMVGKPAAMLLLERHATVTICHSRTQDLAAHVKRAAIVVVSVGRPHLVKGEWIRPGAVVIDVGENVVDGKLIGDVEFEAAKGRAAFISPVPGGVGPLTNVMLMKNLVAIHRHARGD